MGELLFCDFGGLELMADSAAVVKSFLESSATKLKHFLSPGIDYMR